MGDVVGQKVEECGDTVGMARTTFPLMTMAGTRTWTWTQSFTSNEIVVNGPSALSGGWWWLVGGCFSLYRLPRPKTIRICLDMYGVDAHIYVAIYCIVCRLLLSCQLFNLFQANKRTKDTISDWLSIWANAIGGKCGRMLLKSFYAFF